MAGRFVLCAVVAAGALAVPAAPGFVDPDVTGHTVRYVVKSDGGREVTIHYRVDAPTDNWHRARLENIWISPTEQWEQTVVLDEPIQVRLRRSARNMAEPELSL